MIEILLGAALVGASSAISRAVWLRRAARMAKANAAAAAEPPRGRSRSPGLHPGDVLMLAGSEVALERASELDDGGILRVLESIAAEPRYVIQLDVVGDRLVLAVPYTGLSEGRVADVVEVGGRPLTLLRRGEAAAHPVDADRDGLWSGRVRFAVLADRGGKHLVVLDPEGGPRIALAGDLLDRRLVDVLPGR